MGVIIANEANLWATWLYAPVLTTRVDQVYATIRTMGYPEQGRPIFRGGDGGPPPLDYALYDLIERCVKVGPVGRRTRRNDKKISIKEIVIDVTSSDVSASKILPGEHRIDQESKQYRKENGPILLRDPEYILRHVLQNLEAVLRMTYHTASWGVLIYERMGRSKFCWMESYARNGRLQKNWRR